MKKFPPQKKSTVSVKITVTRKKKMVSCKKASSRASHAVSSVKKKKSPKLVSQGTLKESPSKEDKPKKQRAIAKNNLEARPLDSLLPQISPGGDNPSITSLKSSAKCKKNRRKIARNQPFYDLDEEMEFELDDQEFSDEELISLDEFDSILNETKRKHFKDRDSGDDFESDFGEIEQIRRHKTTDHRGDLPHSPGSDKLVRRKKVQRRRQIDPTTCERDYTTEEIEFMTALDEYKRNSGRMFPTCSEILEVLRSLGYAKVLPAPVIQEQTEEQKPVNVTKSIPVIDTKIIDTQTLTLMVENSASEIQPPPIVALEIVQDQDTSSLILNSLPPVIETAILPDVFPAKDFLEQTFLI